MTAPHDDYFWRVKDLVSGVGREATVVRIAQGWADHLRQRVQVLGLEAEPRWVEPS